MYNVLVKEFGNGSKQVKLFSKPMNVPKNKNNIIIKKEEILKSPFDNSVCTMIDDDEIKKERSINSSMSRTVNKIFDYSRSNDWSYFFTFTFDKKYVDRYNYDDCSYILYSYLHYMRKKTSFQYLIVPEMHKDNAFHFHGLFFNVDTKVFKFSNFKGNIYNVDSFKYGYTTVSEIKNLQATQLYICKYITKDLIRMTKGKKRYWCSRGLNLPTISEYLLDIDSLDLLQDDLILQSDFIKTINVKNGYNFDLKVFEINS